MGIKIIATGRYVPERVLTNADLEKMVETSDEWIRTRTGIETRHIADASQATSDMCREAAKKALEMAGIAPSELGAIVVATITPDHSFPNTACLLQEEIGAKNAFCFDLSAACSGLIYSLVTAQALMKMTPNLKYVLVLGAEKLSSIVDWDDRNTCVLFGDGAAAVILEKTDDGNDSIKAYNLGADGACKDILFMPAGGSRMPASLESVQNRKHFINMTGKEVFKFAVNAMVSSSQQAMTDAGVAPDDIKFLVPHQANYRILKAVAQRLDIPEERVYMNLNRSGTTSAASIGLCLDEMVRNNLLQKGDKVLLTAFGGGLTWGSIVLEW